jgi:permuted papain-like amidase YaeF/Yiix C92 family enzyme
MGVVLDTIGKWIANYLQQEVHGYEPFTPSDPDLLRSVIEPGDVLLVEGNNRISGIIKYLTQSTWSHAALYVGPIDGAEEPDGEPHVLIEAYVGDGVITAPLSKYFAYHTRLSRPVGLSYEDRNTVCRYAINRIGFGYDTKNILDLMRFLVPLPVPQRWRRRMIALGSGDPTKMICSALIAQAFDAVRYPILPKITRAGSRQARSTCRAISTSRPISKSSNPPSCAGSTTPRCTGPTSRSRSRRWRANSVCFRKVTSGRRRLFLKRLTKRRRLKLRLRK